MSLDNQTNYILTNRWHKAKLIILALLIKKSYWYLGQWLELRKPIILIITTMNSILWKLFSQLKMVAKGVRGYLKIAFKKTFPSLLVKNKHTFPFEPFQFLQANTLWIFIFIHFLPNEAQVNKIGPLLKGLISLFSPASAFLSWGWMIWPVL